MSPCDTNTCQSSQQTQGYCWRTPKSRKFYPVYGFFEPRGAWNIACRHVGLRIEMGSPTVSEGLMRVQVKRISRDVQPRVKASHLPIVMNNVLSTRYGQTYVRDTWITHDTWSCYRQKFRVFSRETVFSLKPSGAGRHVHGGVCPMRGLPSPRCPSPKSPA
jgi:hypothetical protein